MEKSEPYQLNRIQKFKLIVQGVLTGFIGMVLPIWPIFWLASQLSGLWASWGEPEENPDDFNVYLAKKFRYMKIMDTQLENMGLRIGLLFGLIFWICAIMLSHISSINR